MTDDVSRDSRVTPFPTRTREVPPRLAALAAKVEATKAGVPAQEVPDSIAIGVLVAGFVLCTIGAIAAPEMSVAGAEVSWAASIISTIFWGAAFIGAVGLYFRLRRGLVFSLVAALAFLSAPIASAIMDPGVIGKPWFVQLVCAFEFAVLCVGGLRSC